MNKHDICLSDLAARGRAATKPVDGALELWTTRSITSIAFNLYGDSYKRHVAELPGEYRLPFRIDMNAKLDYPSFILLIGGGHISFSTPSKDNRKIEDILKPSGKPNQDHYFYNDNNLPLGEYTDISVIYNLNEMQIIIGGEERYFSQKQAYMKSKRPFEYDPDKLKIRLAVTKLSTLSIKSISVTEYDKQAPIVRGAFVESSRNDAQGERPKPSFESAISGLTHDYQSEIRAMDKFLTSLRPMKFRRAVDKNGGKISYVASGYGFSYAINLSGAATSHNFGWYIVTNGKPETWGRKADNMEQALVETAKTDPALAERVFYALNDCVGCYGPRCLAKTLYAFNGQKRLTCHGRAMLRMRPGDFSDARGFINIINSTQRP